MTRDRSSTARCRLYVLRCTLARRRGNRATCAQASSPSRRGIVRTPAIQPSGFNGFIHFIVFYLACDQKLQKVVIWKPGRQRSGGRRDVESVGRRGGSNPHRAGTDIRPHAPRLIDCAKRDEKCCFECFGTLVRSLSRRETREEGSIHFASVSRTDAASHTASCPDQAPTLSSHPRRPTASNEA